MKLSILHIIMEVIYSLIYQHSYIYIYISSFLVKNEYTGQKNKDMRTSEKTNYCDINNISGFLYLRHALIMNRFKNEICINDI